MRVGCADDLLVLGRNGGIGVGRGSPERRRSAGFISQHV
jgi:hypothetical protein